MDITALPRCGLETLAGGELVLCRSARLARQLVDAFDRHCQAAGQTVWQPLRCLTAGQWLQECADMALLRGSLPPERLPQSVTPLQELALWEVVIASTREAFIAADTAQLLDRRNLARTALAANALVEEWQLKPEQKIYGKETEAFLRWRSEFRQRLDGRLEPVRYLAWQLACLHEGLFAMPEQIVFAGYIEWHPHDRALCDTLITHGVRVLRFDHSATPFLGDPDHLSMQNRPLRSAFADTQAQYAAAAAWVAHSRKANPQARLAIFVPELAGARHALAYALAYALDSTAYFPPRADASHGYEFSLGTPLAHLPAVDCALALLALGQTAADDLYDVVEFGTLLRNPWWGGWQAQEARHAADRKLRALLPGEMALLEIEATLAAEAPELTREVAFLRTVTQAAQARAQHLPSAWCEIFCALLQTAQWPTEPGGQALSSVSWQIRDGFLQALASLAQYDAVLGKVSYAQALDCLRQVCREQIFQPESRGSPMVQILGMLETPAEPLDALWVVDLDDSTWPPAPHVNALLPTNLQRQAQTPGASAEGQLSYAQALLARLLTLGRTVIFSHAAMRADGRASVASPVAVALSAASDSASGHDMQGLLDVILPTPTRIAAMAQTCAGHINWQSLADVSGPALPENSMLSGGVAVLRAQAHCPAWAFFEFRLQAAALPKPVYTLDAAMRGQITHAALEYFWRLGDSATFLALSEDDLAVRIHASVEEALRSFQRRRYAPRTPRLLALEGVRQCALLKKWLAQEALRPAPFRVVAREQNAIIDIAGIRLSIKIDRIDAIALSSADASSADAKTNKTEAFLVLDYKTGRLYSLDRWAYAGMQGKPLLEPQLPLYAVCLPHISGAALAAVNSRECSFSGLTTGAWLPTVSEAPPEYGGWEALQAAWHKQLFALAMSLRLGQAHAFVRKEEHLQGCRVLPLLRRAEYAAMLVADKAVYAEDTDENYEADTRFAT